MDTSPTKQKKRPHEASTDSPDGRKKAKTPKTHKADSKEKKTKSKHEKHDNHDKKARKDKEHKFKQEKSHIDATPEQIRFPFFTQTISLWVPLFPIGFDRPISSVANQHLAGFLNQYSPQLGGYLLAYSNVNLSEASVRADPKNPPTDKTSAVLTSVDEYAVGFGWMTVDIDLFVPSRGAWLEGDIILQNEGAIGVNCWEKFNASIEAARLPHGWTYVDGGAPVATAVDAGDAEDSPDAEDMNKTQEDGADDAAGNTVHAAGHWVDASGQPVSGTIRFRIKDFDVGVAGDHGCYLSIEGTMLERAEELRRVLSERARSRSAKTGGRTRRLPAFSITQFGKDEEEDGNNQHAAAATTVLKTEAADS